MDLSREAIEQICFLSENAADINWPVSLAAEPPCIAVPGTVRLQDIEEYLPHRRAFRGEFNTASMLAFRDYIAPFEEEQPCFIDGDTLRAVVYLDIGSGNEPGHCRHRASLQVKRTAAFAALLAANEKPMSQRELAEWLEDWNASLAAVDAMGVEMELAAAVRAVRNIIISATTDSKSSIQNMSETRGTLAKIEATSEAGLPAGFIFTCQPTDELVERSIRVDLAVITGEKPVLKLRIRAKAALDEDIASEFAVHLKGCLPAGIRPLVGAFKPN